MAWKRRRPIAESETKSGRDDDDVGPVAATVGDKHDVARKIDESVEAAAEGEVAMGDEHPFDAAVGQMFNRRRHRAVQADTGAPDDGGAHFGGPARHGIVVAHHEPRVRIGRDQHELGHFSRQPSAVGRREMVGEAPLRKRERFHGDEDGSSHRASLTRSLRRVTRAIRVAVIGAGSWGTTVAALAAVNTPTVLWSRRSDLAAEINEDHRNQVYLPGFELPAELRATASLAEAVTEADVLVMGVPSHGFRAVMREAAGHLRPWVPVVSLTKGLEADSLARMSEVVNQEAQGHPVAVLTGPNLAKEILAGQPAATVVAIDDAVIAEALQRTFSAVGKLRVYTEIDTIGCEVAGVVKNVIAIASGMASGMGFGDNTKATLMTRGLAEMTRLGVALGGDAVTFSGLAGMGDLIATCSSKQSRNHSVGFQLGLGRTIEDILGEMHMVAEGVKSCRSVLALAHRHGVEMPITEQVVAVCHEGATASSAVMALMMRGQKAERFR